jgi:hypothetical protein
MHKSKPPKARPIRQIKTPTSYQKANNVRPKTKGVNDDIRTSKPLKRTDTANT